MTNPGKGKPFVRGGTGAQTFEEAVKRLADKYRIDREARRRVEDALRPPVDYPPVRPLNELLAQHFPPQRYRIDKVAPSNGRVLLSAQYKAGKSTIVGNLLRSLADGLPFLGEFAVDTPASAIVLVDDEMSARTVADWLRAQGITHTDAVADVITLRGNVGAFNLLDDQCLARWVKRLAELGCDYLIIDCLRPVLDALGLDENHDAGRFLVAWDALMTQAGVPDACLLQHMGHANERARGDSRFQDWPDAIWRLVREDDEPGSPRYFSAYGRDVDVAEGRLSFNPTTRHLTYAGGSRRNAKAEAALLAIVRLLAENHRNGEDGMPAQAIEAALALDHPRAAVRDALKSALGAANPRIGWRSGPHGARLHHLLHPCESCGMPVTDGSARHLSCPGSGQ